MNITCVLRLWDVSFVQSVYYHEISGMKLFLSFCSALRDRRFPPIQAKEIPYLECTVSVLADYESGLHYLDWEVCY